LYSYETDFAVLSITMERSSFKSIKVEESVILAAVNYLDSLNGAYVFKNSGNEVTLVFDAASADEYIDRILKRFEQAWDKSKKIVISPYWVFVPNSSLADNADDLMYLIRYARQNNAEPAESHFYRVGSELAERLSKEKEIERLIADAVINDRIEVWYQPIFSTEQRRFSSAEALVRIRREDGELIPPVAFIPIAESNGSILKVGEVVFRKVCEFLNKSNIREHGLSYIEVNLSVVQCAYNKLSDDYIAIMEDYGISPDMINLEITESASMNAKNTLLGNMKALTDYGVNFSLDDFGTGHSNLDYIVDMPVEIVKFDKGMTTAYFENGKAKYIMDAAMSMIQGLNLKIVSEGIETEEQFKVMDELGINYIQGYYFSKPLPEDEFTEFIIKNNK
ncbi:MAG: EAL domain-containing protein, partial [Oscillospiraceae bacterium]|nr:EAL domain-containing protein [Oscillospiraceae bacterium]